MTFSNWWHKGCRAENDSLWRAAAQLQGIMQRAQEIIYNRRATTWGRDLEQRVTHLIDELEQKEQTLDKAAKFLWDIYGGTPLDENFRDALKGFLRELAPRSPL